MKHLTKEEKAAVVEDYRACGKAAPVARRHGISPYMVKKLAQDAPLEPEGDLLSFLEGKSREVCQLIDLYLKDLASPDKLEKTSLPQVASSLGVLIEKFSKAAERSRAAVEEEEEKQGGVVILPFLPKGDEEKKKADGQ